MRRHLGIRLEDYRVNTGLVQSKIIFIFIFNVAFLKFWPPTIKVGPIRPKRGPRLSSDSITTSRLMVRNLTVTGESECSVEK